MERRDFFVSTALGMLGFGVGDLSLAASQPNTTPQVNNRKILIAGGGFGTKFLRYMASLTGKERPKLCYLPTASADRESGIIRWYENCAPLNVVPSVQVSFINSNRMKQTFEEVLLSVDGIVVSGGNTLNQQVIWKARGIVLGGASAGSLCWFEEGTTDSRPQELTKVECLGFLKGSHSPHYDAEDNRRPIYHRMIKSGELKPGYACDNNAGIYFSDNEIKRVVHTREDAKVYYVSLQEGEIVEKELQAEMIE